MPRTPSSPADRPKWLRFEAGDEESHELFAPGANWRKQDQYPALKSLDSYTRNDEFGLSLARYLLGLKGTGFECLAGSASQPLWRTQDTRDR